MGWKAWTGFFCSLWIGAAAVWGIDYTPLGANGEGGSLHGQTFTIGPGGSVYELDSFLHIGGMDLNGTNAGTSARLSTDALPAGLVMAVADNLSANKNDLTLTYLLSNTSVNATFNDVRFFTYFDAEIDEDLNTFFNEFGVMSGTAGSGGGDHAADFWQIDEPGFVNGTLIDQILDGTLINTNKIPLSAPNDVAMGLGFVLGDVGPAQSRLMRIMISEVGHSIGLLSLKHQDVDPDATTTITLSGLEGTHLSLNVNSTGATNVPVTVDPVDGSGQGNGTTGFKRDYPPATRVTLTAAESAGGKVFSNWTGVDSQSGRVAVVTMNADRTATVRYVDLPRNLTVESAGADRVPVAVQPLDRNGAGNGTTVFTRSYTNGARVTLVAAATVGGRIFTSWTGVDSQSGVTGVVTLVADRTLVANYDFPQRVITVRSAGVSNALVAVQPTDNTGAGDGITVFTRTYNNETRVTLVAAATVAGRVFTGWTGVDSQNGVTGVVTMATNRTVTANYAYPPRILTVQSTGVSNAPVAVTPLDTTGAGNGTTVFTRTYNQGARVTLAAAATVAGRVFTGWTGVDSQNGVTGVVTMATNRTVTANYAYPPRILTIQAAGVSNVPVAVTPLDTTGAGNGTTVFTRTYTHGTRVTLAAAATVAGRVFTGWTGVDSQNGVTGVVTLATNRTVTANYAYPPRILTVRAAGVSNVPVAVQPLDTTGAGNGRTVFTRTYNHGTRVTLAAAATVAGRVFTGWTGVDSQNGVTGVVTLAANRAVTANYAYPPRILTIQAAGVSNVPVAVTPLDTTGAGNGSTVFTRTYNHGTRVTLAAAATVAGRVFTGWTGVDSQKGVTGVVTLAASRAVTANYAYPPRILTVRAAGLSNAPVTVRPPDTNGLGNGTTVFTRTYTNGTRVTLVAAAKVGSQLFTGWTGVSSQSGVTGTVALAANRTVTANYAAPLRTLTVRSTGASNAPVTVRPLDSTGAGNGTTVFTRGYTNGAKVTLVAATTVGGQLFTGWSGVDSQNGVTGTVTMASNRTVSANYNQNVWGALNCGLRWRLDQGTGALIGTLSISNPATATRRFVTPAWLVLHRSPDFFYVRPDGTLPNGDGYMVITAAMLAQLRSTGNRNDVVDPGESVAIDNLPIYSRYRLAPAASQFELWMSSQ